MLDSAKIRNIAIIAHVDHGKTTLVDKLLHQSGTLDSRKEYQERLMDSNELERERGITILSKNTGITYKDYAINVVDTPGHADFGGEVERVLNMVDAVLLLVDATDGPMPQTRFVTQKAFDRGLNPIVVVNKVDRDSADPDRVITEVFDLFDSLGATDKQLDFPVIYASALHGWAVKELDDERTDMLPLLDYIIDRVEPPKVDTQGPLQLQVTTLDYSSYVGTLGIGRIARGSVKKNMTASLVTPDNTVKSVKVSGLYRSHGLSRVEVDEAFAGDIVAFSGSDDIAISKTLCDVEAPEPLPALQIDRPTVSMMLYVNDSPFAGKEGKFLTTRQIYDRLMHEQRINVALQVEKTDSADRFLLKGRGELHLSVLLETMRREGFEMAVGRPQVIMIEENGVNCEPFEVLTVDVPTEMQGAIMEEIGNRKGLLQDMQTDDCGRCKMTFDIAARGLIGFHHHFLMMTSGQGIMSHVFEEYRPVISNYAGHKRIQGAMISSSQGESRGYALFNLQERGALFISPGIAVYEGMVVGLHSRGNDLIVNVTKEKQLTNVRASGTDENIVLTPPKKLSLEVALETIGDDELVEVTPENIRLRKIFLKEHERKKAAREAQ